MKLMDSNYSKPLNLGNPEEYSILELANIIKNKLNKNLNIIYKPLPQDDPLQRKPCIKKAKEFLDWSPSIGLNDGLDRTIRYFKESII